MRPSVWTQWLVAVLALWLLHGPATMGYASPALWMSDVLSGGALLVIALVALAFRAGWLRWVSAAVGLWVTAAPLVFWAPDAASYANDTLMGSLVIVCAAVVPSILEERPVGARTPPGWSYDPSSWRQRVPIIALAFVGFLWARYLSAFQLGHIRSIWEPFFGKGTETVLTSDISRAFPVSDAGLGAWSYLLDALSGAIGGARRWRSMPWIVVLFGIMVIPPGVTSITLVILQPIGVGAWCTICLATAVIMLCMVPPAIDEVVATVQVLVRARRSGEGLWRVFWRGVSEEGAGREPAVAVPRERGGSLPWNLVASAVLGVWLMAAPAVLGAIGPASDANHLLGALVTTFAVIAMAQVARPVRFVNSLLGVALALGIWLLDGGSLAYRLSSLATGALILALSLPQGKIPDRFAEYDRWIRWAPWKPRALKGERDRRAA